MSLSKNLIRNGVQFKLQRLKVIKGQIPKSINGSYIKNGTGLFQVEGEILDHWFKGDGALLKLQFHQGNVYASYKFVKTPAYNKVAKQKTLSRPYFAITLLKKLVGFNINPNDIDNTSNTSVLRIKNSNDFFALNQGGLPMRIQEKLMNEKGFDNLGYIQKGFSAHPKVDPQNGDIFNIGFNMQTLNVYKLSSQLKLLAKNSVKLRIPQSIHDCCLAGNYFITFECPMKFNIMKYLKGNFALKCYIVDYDYGKTNVWIFRKDNLELVKKIELNTQTFFVFHFTNGYEQDGKLYLEYAKYPGPNAQKIWDLVQYVPQYANNDNHKFGIYSQLQTLKIQLNDFSYSTAQKQFDCQFPVCQDSQVGKKWQFSYFIAKDKGAQFFSFDKLVKYDRINDIKIIKQFKNCCIVQPALIRTKQALFILTIKTDQKSCNLVILNGQNLEIICQIELPQFIPFGYHGKWLQINQNKFEYKQIQNI